MTAFTIFATEENPGVRSDRKIIKACGCNGTNHALWTSEAIFKDGEVVDANDLGAHITGKCDGTCAAGLADPPKGSFLAGDGEEFLVQQ